MHPPPWCSSSFAGLPVEVRDKFLAEEDRLEVPGSDANREFMTQVHEKQLAEGGNPYSNKPLNQKVRCQLRLGWRRVGGRAGRGLGGCSKTFFSMRSWRVR